MAENLPKGTEIVIKDSISAPFFVVKILTQIEKNITLSTGFDRFL